ncbi:MAG TPA: EAL domain-containing protein [Gammaproteobacteria bacterium]|nr:EAL domain-containing protein [Gammaproteobacteria bacterium]
MPRLSGCAERVSARPLSSADFMRRFRLLILLAWLIPPLFGMSFLLLIGMFSLPQILQLLVTPLEAGFVLGWLLLSQWYFSRFVRPLADWLAQPGEPAATTALARVRAFPRHFWGVFLFYLLLAPASVIISAEMTTDFVATSGDWLRIHLVALIVSIIVGLPVFFAVFDLFGRTLSGLRQPRPVFSIRTKVFMVGALMPLLMDTLLVQYYWTRTGYFTLETLFVWGLLQLLAVLGALMFARSLGQSLQPLEAVVENVPALLDRRPSIQPSSTDELGVLAGRYQDLLERVHFHGKALQVGSLVLANRDVESASGKAFEQVVALCQEALRADIAFLLLFDEAAQELVGVAQTGVPYRPQGHYRIPLAATSMAVFVFRQGSLLAIDDVHGDPRVSPDMVAKFDICAAIATPLRVEDRVIGILMGADQRPGRHYSAEDCALIEVLAREAASVVHTLQLQARRREAEAQFHKADEFARATLQSIADGVVTTDTVGRVDYLNVVAEKLTGWAREEAIGQPLASVLQLIDEDSNEPVTDPVERCLASVDGFSLPGSLNLLSREGDKAFAVDVRVSAIRDAGHRALGVVLVFHDTTELTSLTHRLSYQASHDSLTGLLNRHEFEARLELALESARHENIEHALCYMDLDRFKVVNDTCGHVAGDELLKQLATRMRASIREADTLARLGGDEFGLLLEGCHLAQARGVVNNLLRMVSEFRFIWADKAFDVGISIGLAPISAQSGNITDVLSAADSACYMAKDQGRNRLHVFEPDDLALLHQKGEMQWLQIIRQALENDDFVLYQQAIRPMKGISPAGDDTPHSEILLRLRTGGGEVVAPSSFLPAAERYHLMPQIDRWVVTQVLAFLRTLQAQGGVMNLSINLSGQSLCDEDFPTFVTTAVLASGVPPGWLCFEVTETTAITNLSRAVGLISELKRMGCHFALDDFGSGLSSFNYLKNLPVDYLKIDGSFVKDMDRNPVDRAMVAAINEIGHLMGIQTVAEFVTRLGVLEALDEIGVDYAQGYFIANPEPLLPD